MRSFVMAPQVLKLYRIALVAVMVLMFVTALSAAANADVSGALQSFEDFLKQIVDWLYGPGRYLIAAAWLVVGFRTVLGMERQGASQFIFVALVGMAIVFAPDLLRAVGVDIIGWTKK